MSYVQVKSVRDYSKIGDEIAIPDLIEIQTKSYADFLQEHVKPSERQAIGLEALLREVFPIKSYDEHITLEYVEYELQKPRNTVEECRELRLTYGMPLRVKVRMHRKDKPDTLEEAIYLGDLPIMIGGGEFIINGAERVIVSQLHRSPGIDFVIEEKEGDRPLHTVRVIPERGSWIEITVTKKDLLAVRIDQSSKIPATTFLRALDERFGPAEAILREFYETRKVKVDQLEKEFWSVSDVRDPATSEVIIKAGCQLGDNLEKLAELGITDLQVIEKVSDPLILNTLAEDGVFAQKDLNEHEVALLKIYARLRPGNPGNLEKARTLFKEKFFDDDRYRLGRVGRFRLNRKFGLNVGEENMVLRAEDIVHSLHYLFKLRNGEGHVDDIDHLGNRRLRTIDELAAEELRKGFLKLRRTVQERMSVKELDSIERISDLINSKSISSSIDFFFGRSELSQVVDQTNPLSMITHERRLSALGPGGLNRKRAGFEVRDVHISHYGRICPIETPEGANIGLISSLSVFSGVDDYGFLITPYRVVENGKATRKVVHLRADEENDVTIAPADALVDREGNFPKGQIRARVQGELAMADPQDVQYVDISPKQAVGVSASLIPFLEHDDANRALMGSNMQRQAVPLMKADPPVVGTGIERVIAANSGMVIRARKSGRVTLVDGLRIVIDGADEYVLTKFQGSTDRTCINHRPLVTLGQKVKAGEIIAEGPSCTNRELALGKNVLVAFMTYDGYNFEDAIVISERLVKEDAFTSIHIQDFEVEIRETKLGKEEFTRDIPNVSEKALRNLDDRGVVRIGTRVQPGDILVGKVSPKNKTELTPEEKLLHAIFGRAGEDVKNDSLEVPSGTEGIVIGAKRFSRRMNQSAEQTREIKQQMDDYRIGMNRRLIEFFRQMIDEVNALLGTELVDPNSRQKVGKSNIDDVVIEQIEQFDLKWIRKADDRERVGPIWERYRSRLQELQEERDRKLAAMKRGDELPSGVLEMVKVWIATKRSLSVGDKMAGRHGNKGVIARIVPEEDMPFMADGRPVDILLNPLGVPSRMNIGQILETHLAWACAVLGFQAVTPVFDGATEDEVHAAVDEANAHVRQRTAAIREQKLIPDVHEHLVEMPYGGKIQLYDGRTGEPLDQKTTVGYIYMLKLHHLVDDKIHARSTGPYSLITQQPLGGKARTGGQRFGEMEVWALEAYGAAYILQELLTVKSDDVEGRTRIYESMVKGNNTLDAGMPVSFDVLCNEIRGLGLNIQLVKKEL